MHEVLEIMFRSFWTFLGFALLIEFLCTVLFKCWNRFLRMLNIRAHGWPPAHCDADGDFKPPSDRSDT